MRKIIHDCDCTFGINGCDVDDGLALLYLLGGSGSRGSGSDDNLWEQYAGEGLRKYKEVCKENWA